MVYRAVILNDGEGANGGSSIRLPPLVFWASSAAPKLILIMAPITMPTTDVLCPVVNGIFRIYVSCCGYSIARKSVL